MSTSKSTHIHWFLNDLRLHDQPFTAFLKDIPQHFGVYVIDPRKYGHLKYGFRKTGMLRIQFLRENLVDLQERYRALGSDLLVVTGYPEDLIPQLVCDYDATLSYQLEYATEERRAQDAILRAVGEERVQTYDGNFLVAPEVIHLMELPNSFSGFRNKAEKVLKKEVLQTVETPTRLPSAPKDFQTINVRHYKRHVKTVFPFKGGQTAADGRLMAYLFESREIDHYKNKRNGLMGVDYSSKLSPWLASGAISPKTIYSTLKRYESLNGANDGTYWLFFELLWRDYFRHAGKTHKDALFYAYGISGKQQQPKKIPQDLEPWTTGKTEVPFINANMKELALTGWMSNRGRQNVASYFVHDLKMDWRLGAAWFEHNLLDYDVYSNQGNWLYISGHGFNPKGAAVFDLNFQTKRYDSEGKYQQKWLNEEIS